MAAVLDAPTALDPRALRQTLGRFATGITVISARTEAGEEAAITANSFTSVSLDPPLVLWSVAREAFSASIFQRASHFVVHVLSEQQRDISQHFARRQPDKLTGVAHTRDADGGLELPGWLALGMGHGKDPRNEHPVVTGLDPLRGLAGQSRQPSG